MSQSEAMDISQAGKVTRTPPQLVVEEAFVANASSSTSEEEGLSRISGNPGEYLLNPNPPSPTHSQDSCHMDEAIEQGELNVFVIPTPTDPKARLQRNNSQIASGMPSYPMEIRPRGLALIVEMEKFDNDVQEQRVGSRFDVINLRKLFEGLHFKVEVQSNLTRSQLDKKLTDFARDERQEHANMMILAVLSHGKDGHIYTADGLQYQTENIYKKFNNQNCPALEGKPKFFIIQACRGDDTDKGHYPYGSSPSSSSSIYIPGRDSGPSAARKRRVASTERDTVPWTSQLSEIDKARPTWEDMIIAYSTIPGFASIRDHDKGTWFVQSIVEVFMNHAQDRELIDLLRMTSERLSHFTNEYGEKQTCNIEMRHFYRRLYFNPGQGQPVKKVKGGSGSPNLLRRSKSTPPASPRRHGHEQDEEFR